MVSPGRLRASLARQGAPIGACELLLAATALRRGLTFVTHNMRAFERIGGLGLQDWRECQAGGIPDPSLSYPPHTTPIGPPHIEAGLNSPRHESSGSSQLLHHSISQH